MKPVFCRKRAGQNTVEYLLMLAVIVGVVLVAGIAMKRYMPTLFDQVSVKISQAVDSMGRGAGNRD
ncbi:MAG: hypothetical protein FD154_2508 [Elusimicrobia bacterium]|nr:MAG: hypothetical protein FD154_2508 [Elusimicrobiota bacterium]